MKPYIEKGVLCCGQGIPYAPRWISDGRLSCSVDEQGIERLEYCGTKNRIGNPVVFVRRMWDGIRCFLNQGGVNYKPAYIDTRIWPFGIEADWEHNGDIFSYKVLCVDESLIMQIRTPSTMSAADVKFSLECTEEFALEAGDKNDLTLDTSGEKRVWNDWTFYRPDNILSAGYRAYPAAAEYEKTDGDFTGEAISNLILKPAAENPPEDVIVCFSADFPLSHTSRAHTKKHILESPVLKAGNTYSFFIALGSNPEAVRKKIACLTGEIDKKIDAQFSRYRLVADAAPVLKSPYTQINDFLAIAPLYHEALKLKDRPGALRAKVPWYWMWGWDAMTCGQSECYWGDTVHVKDLLAFFEQHSHPEYGIVHRFNNDFSPNQVYAKPSQGIYIALLHEYFIATEDIDEIKRRYPFAKKIFGIMLSSVADSCGFGRGGSLYPDYPVLMQETGNDLSTFNNTIFYCGMRSMESLASLMGDEETRKRAEELFKNMERDFLRLFFDEEKKYFVNSIDSVNLQKRYVFNTGAVKWENEYCRELLGLVREEALTFLEEHALCSTGLRPIPLWDKAFDADGNQFHTWFPVTGEYYMRLINECGRKDLIEKTIQWISFWTERVTVPEGISCYIESEEPECDRWTSLLGSWYSFTIRAWYNAVMHSIVGICIENGGIVFYPYDSEEMSLKGLHYRGKIIDIDIRGSGPYIERIEVNGADVIGTHKVPVDLLSESDRNTVTVYKAAEDTRAVYIKNACGAELYDYCFKDGGIETKVRGAGTCRILLGAGKKPAVRCNGRELAVQYDGLHTASAELLLSPASSVQLSISAAQ